MLTAVFRTWAYFFLLALLYFLYLAMHGGKQTKYEKLSLDFNHSPDIMAETEPPVVSRAKNKGLAFSIYRSDLQVWMS